MKAAFLEYCISFKAIIMQFTFKFAKIKKLLIRVHENDCSMAKHLNSWCGVIEKPEFLSWYKVRSFRDTNQDCTYSGINPCQVLFIITELGTSL